MATETFGWEYPPGVTDGDFDLPDAPVQQTWVIFACLQCGYEWEAEATVEDGHITLCEQTEANCARCGHKGRAI